MEAVILHLILQRPGACKPSCWWYCACTPAVFAGLCLSGPCWTPKTSTNAAGSAAAVAKMMMLPCGRQEAWAVLLAVPPGRRFSLWKDINSKGGIKLLLGVAKAISDTQIEKYFTIMPIVTKLSSNFAGTKLRSFSWHFHHSAFFRIRLQTARWQNTFRSAGFLHSAMLWAVTLKYNFTIFIAGFWVYFLN